MSDIVQESAKKYVDNKNEIKRRERIIERHEKKISSIRSKNWWGDIILTPIMNAVRERFKDVEWDDNRFVPMGLRNAVSVFGKYQGEILMLRFTPSADGFVNLDIKPEYSTHGFGSKTAIVDNIDVVFNHVETQIKEKIFVD